MSIDWSQYTAALFDLDGVLTPTAEVHRAAWAHTFEAFLDTRDGQDPYTEQDYFDHVDGKPRYDGVRDFLSSRGIELPEGEPDDPPGLDSVCGIGNRKNEEFGATLAEQGIEPYPGSLRLLEALAERGTAMAVVSSSANAPDVVRTAGIERFFGTIVHGGTAHERHLRGKPAPDYFRAAADDLGVGYDVAVVLEDAVSGTQAGHDGGFGLVVGVDRGAGAETLRAHGADVVVDDLAELI